MAKAACPVFFFFLNGIYWPEIRMSIENELDGKDGLRMD